MRSILLSGVLMLVLNFESRLFAQPASSLWPRGSVIFVAHRGGMMPGYPENTLRAFRHAVEQGAHAIEIDLRGTKDGEVIILHDQTLSRTTTGEGDVEQYALAELRTLDAGDGERIPTFQEVLHLVDGSGVKLLLDIKESEILDKAKVVRLVEKYDAVLDVIVGARTLEDVRAFRLLNPNLRLLGFVPSVEAIDAFADSGIDIVRLWPAWVEADPGLIEEIHLRGKSVWVTAGTASRQELEALVRKGVNGILSDDLHIIHDLIEDMKKALAQ